MLLTLPGMVVTACASDVTEGGWIHLPCPESPARLSSTTLDVYAQAYPMFVQLGATVRFYGTVSLDYIDMRNYTWEITNGPEVCYRYTAVTDFTTVALGNCTAVLTVLGPYDESDTASVTVTVSTDAEDSPPVADAGRYWVIPSNTTVTLDGRGSFDDWGITDYVWTFDDGGTQTLVGPVCNYTFEDEGVYDICLEVTDTGGNNGSSWTWVMAHVPDNPPVAEAGPDQTVLEGTAVTLNGSASTDDSEIREYEWSFSDGTDFVWLVGPVVIHVFDLAGTYAVVLTVIDDMGNSVTDLVTITVTRPPPVADAGADVVVEVGTECRFNGTGSSASGSEPNYVWNFRQGGTYEVLMGPEPAFTFAKTGTFYVTLTVTDDHGQSDIDVVVVTVFAHVDDEALGDWLIVAGVAAAAGVATVAAMRFMKLL